MASTRTTGNEPTEAADPGGTRSTKPGNPDKSGASRPGRVTQDQDVVSGDRNSRRSEDDPATD
jgi:hypothetical protein